MKRRSIWLVLGLLLVTVLFAVTGCKETEKIEYRLSETEIVLKVGETKELTVSPAPETTVAWTSDNEGVATVSNGVVSAVGEGTAKITATIEGSDPLTCSVKVEKEPPVVTGEYYLDLSSVSLKTGETKQISVLDDKGQPAQSVTYSSENPAVATVSENGTVTAVAVGETKIKAAVDGAELFCTVSVAQKYTYSLDKTELDLAAGAHEKITLISTPEIGDDARPHTFSSSDPGVATVDGGSGKVTGVAKGNAVITCLVDGEELTATVKVTEYTVKIDGEVMTAETALRVGEQKEITVTADPAREFTPVFVSGDESVCTVSNGRLVPLKEGTTVISVTAGGRVFQTTVTVASEVLYSINHEEIKLNLSAENNTASLIVTRDPAGEVKVTFRSSDESVATVNADGLVTAKGIGTAVITTQVTGTNVSFETSVSVTLPATLTHEDYTFASGSVNLTYLDENKTIDWRQYHTSEKFQTPARMKDNANLIGDYSMIGCDDEAFWDYKAPVFVEDAEGAESFGVYTYGRAVHGSYTVPVKVTGAVSKIVILTGSWKETATIEFKIGDTVLQSESFAGGDNALCRKYVLSIDTSSLLEGESLDLTISLNCNRAHGGNISLVGVAVVGKVPHEKAKAGVRGQATRNITGQQNLTDVGNVDWASANGTRKAGVAADSVINLGGIAYAPASGTAHDYPGATFTWADGTAEAPANLKTFCHADDTIRIPVRLNVGTSTVTVYATGWNCGYLVALYDKNGTFLNGYQGADEVQWQSVSSKVVFTVNAEEAGEYTILITKCRGAGNCGWAAVAVAQECDYTLAQSELALNIGETGKIEVLKDGGVNTDAVRYVSNNETVATVESDGTVTAVGKGAAVITVTVGNTDLFVKVNVTEPAPIFVTTEAIDYENGKDYTINLSKLDEKNQTIDWHYFGNGFTDQMKGGSAIGELSGERAAYFYDYRVKINWSDGTAREASFNDLTDGWTFKNSVSVPVSVTNKTQYIAILTGAWHAKNTIEVKCGDTVCATYEFSNCGNNDGADKNKQFRIYPDVSELKGTQTLTVTMTCGGEPDHGWADNISLVAIAVVGTDARVEKSAGTATAAATPLMPEEDHVINLTEVGTLDWVYTKNGNGGLTRKAGLPANTIIRENEIRCLGGDGYDTFGNKKQYFSWTDGVDAVSGDKVNNFRWINEKYYIPVRLPAGQNEVTLYLSGWKCSYFVTVLDGYGNKLIDAQKLVNGDGNSSQAVTLKVSVNALETSTFTFIMTKEGDGNHGFAAVAVAQQSDYTLAQIEMGLKLGETGKIEVLKNGGVNTDAVRYVSNNEAVATVAADGTVTAVGRGSAVITVTVGTTDLFLYVNVTEQSTVISVTADAIDYANGTDNTVNLTTIDESNQTLDWRYFGRDDYTDRMKGGSLLGEVTGERAGTFYDYRVKINWSNGTNREVCYADYTNGWTFKSISFDVTVTSDVKYIAILTGAWHAKNTIVIKSGDTVLSTYEFVNRGDNGDVDKNKQVRFYPDVSGLKEPLTLTVTMTCGAEPDHGWTDNISLVAIAVVSNTARPTQNNTAAVQKVTPLAELTGETVNLTEVGTLDWVYAKNGDGGLTRKAGVPENSVIEANEIMCFGGDGYDFIGGKQFTWTDGTSEVANGKVNNFQWINERYYIPVHLPAGRSEVTLYLSGWKCSYFLTVLDGFGGKLIDSYKLVNGDGSNSQAVEVKLTVNAEQEGTFTFIMTKEGDGNHGWAAVAVAALPAEKR